MRRNLYRIAFLLILFLLPLTATAQQITFKELINLFETVGDYSASRYSRADLNGRTCALIKVQLPVEGCLIEGDVVGDVEFRVTEYWVYVPENTKRLIIRCPGMETSTVVWQPNPGNNGVRSGVTYSLRLSGYSTNVPVTLTMHVSPANATVIIDGKMYDIVSGRVVVDLPEGDHEYMVAAKGYKGYEGVARLKIDGSNTVRIDLEKEEDAAATATVTTPSMPPPAATAQTSTDSVSLSGNMINGHEYVDLGLSVKWATCNVGANSPSDYGDYFAWGETTTKEEYTEDNSKTYGKSSYNRDIGGDPSLDAARANWGDTWRLPTDAEMQELIDNCSWTWTKRGGHKGYKVTSKKNGNSIFLPAAGRRYGSSLYRAGKYGHYWMSSSNESNSDRARYLYFYSAYYSVAWNDRYLGRSIRPVSE